MSVKITSLELENIKRIKAVKLEPSENGLTIIGGNNCQGKTSVLDAIAWALGGERYRPATPHRTGAYTEPFLHIVLSNGGIVERKGKNSSLKVVDPTGNRSGQQLLNTFLTTFALDLPKFLQAIATRVSTGDISIHAPTQGATSDDKQIYSAVVIYFNPHPSAKRGDKRFLFCQQPNCCRKAYRKGVFLPVLAQFQQCREFLWGTYSLIFYQNTPYRLDAPTRQARYFSLLPLFLVPHTMRLAF